MTLRQLLEQHKMDPDKLLDSEVGSNRGEWAVHLQVTYDHITGATIEVNASSNLFHA